MKRAFLMAIAAAAVALVGCNYDTDETASPGYTMYTQSTQSNEYLMDGVNVAIRFAKLMAEVDASGASLADDTEENWALVGDFTYPYNGVSYNKKTFLMGDTNDLTITENSTGVYELNYWVKSGTLKGEMSSAWFDPMKRKGAYQITTNNLRLEDTSAATPWVITICNDGSYDPDDFDEDDDDDDDEEEYAIEFENYMTFRNDSPYLNAVSYNATLWCVGNGVFAFSADMDIRYYDEDYDYTDNSSWSIDYGTMTFDNYSNLTVESTINNDVELSFDSAGGTSIYYNYTLTYLTSSPLIYNYAKSPYTCYGGVEEVTIYNVDSYYFPKKTAIVETWSSGLHTVYYNDETYTW